MKFVLSHALCPEGMALLEEKSDIFVADNGDPNNYLEQMQDADAIILRIAKMDAHAIESSPGLRVIGRTGVGYDSVDVTAATKAGIPIVITPGCNNRSVAEHAVTMMLAASKNLVEGHVETVKGKYHAVRSQNKAFEILGKKAGFIGLGAIGRETAQICRALGMETLGYDPFLTREQIEEAGCTYYESYEAMLPDCDFVSLHVPLTPGTKDMIGREQLAKMKNTAVLVNCARGGIVNEADLIEALEKGVIAGAGTDVFVAEPPPADDPLLQAPNLICSPHSAAQTREAVIKMATMCVEGCLAVLNGEKWPFVANKEAYDHPRWQGK